MDTAERRIVTVVFVDLVGFTALAERLDADDLALVRQRHVELTERAVRRHGGQVQKYGGGAVCAAFGASGAAEDHAVRAVTAALDIVAAVANLGPTFALPATVLPASVLRVRVGVATGEVAATTVHGRLRLSGDPLNLAARLQAAAEPGGVLVDANTALAVVRQHHTEAAGALSLPGKAPPVLAWRVLGEGALAHSRLHASLVGRGPDLSVLWDELGRADGRTGRVLLVAPPGVGKTRLADDFGLRALDLGHPLWTASVTQASGSGYAVIADLLRDALGETPREELAARLCEGRPGPREELAVAHTAALLDGKRLVDPPADLYSSWCAVLDSCATGKPAIWVLDDAHLASPDLLAFVRHAAHSDTVAGRLILLTTRPPALDRLSGADPGMRVLKLDPIPPGSARRMLMELVGAEVLAPEVVEGVAAAADGNPLFIEELVRSWALTGLLVRDPKVGWRFTGGRDVALPSTVHAVCMSQLDVLRAEERRVATTGSVAGPTFPAGAVQALGVTDPTPGLATLTEWGLLVGPQEDALAAGSYTYRHGLLRDVAYSMLLRADRAALHYRFAGWIERHLPTDLADELVATHLMAAYEASPSLGERRSAAPSRAGIAVQAATWLERAAERLFASAPQRAAELLRQALELTGPQEGAAELRRRLALAECLRQAGLLTDAMFGFYATGRAAAGRADTKTLSAAALGYEKALLASRLPRSEWGLRGVDLLIQAVELTEHDPPAHASVLAALGQVQVYGGAPEQGADTSRAALVLADQLGDGTATARALLALRATLLAPEQLPERLRGSTRIIAAARRSDDLETEIEGLRLRMVDLLAAGDMASAEEARTDAEAAIERLGRPLYFWYPYMWGAMRALLIADSSARERVAEFREQGELWHYADVDQVHGAQLLILHADHGTVGEIIPVLEQLRERHGTRWNPMLSYGYTLAGRFDDAHRLLETLAEGRFSPVGRDMSTQFSLSLCAAVASGIGEKRISRVLLGLLAPGAGNAVVLGSGAVCAGAAAYFAGLAAQTAGETRTAATLLRRAVLLNDSMGALPWAVRARLALSKALAELGDEYRSAEMRHRALELATPLGLAGLHESNDQGGGC
jgi:class 3 adenylate cyclase